MFGNIVNLFDIYCFSEVPFHFSLGLVLEPGALLQLGDRTCPCVTVDSQGTRNALPAPRPARICTYTPLKR